MRASLSVSGERFAVRITELKGIVMKNHVLGSVCAALIIGLSAGALPGGVGARLAGPPLICEAFDVDGARTLGGSNGSMDGYDKKELIKDTLDALNPKAPTIVRMEVIRRAVMASGNSAATSRELLLRLTARVLDAEANGKPDARTWFDAGYFSATISQLGTELGFDPGRESGCDGYAWLKKAATIDANDAGMQFACALAVHPAMHKGTQEMYEKHLVKAAGLIDRDPLVKKNLDSHCKNWSVKVEELKKKERAGK